MNCATALFVSKEFRKIVDNEYELLSERFTPGVKQAWDEGQPHFHQIKEAIRNINPLESGKPFDQRGLSGKQLALKMKLVRVAESLIVDAGKNRFLILGYLPYTGYLLHARSNPTAPH